MREQRAVQKGQRFRFSEPQEGVQHIGREGIHLPASYERKIYLANGLLEVSAALAISREDTFSVKRAYRAIAGWCVWAIRERDQVEFHFFQKQNRYDSNRPLEAQLEIEFIE